MPGRLSARCSCETAGREETRWGCSKTKQSWVGETGFVRLRKGMGSTERQQGGLAAVVPHLSQMSDAEGHSPPMQGPE